MKKTLLSALKHGSGILLTLFSLLCSCQVWADYTYTLYMYVNNDAPSYVYVWDANDNYIGNAWHGTAWGDFSKTRILESKWYKHTVTSPTTTYGMLVNDGSSSQSSDIPGLQDAWVKIDGSNSASNYGIPTEYFIPGSFNSWNTSSTSFTEFDESHLAFVYTVVLDANTYSYKIYKGGWYGTNANTTRGNFGGLSKDGDGNLNFTLTGRKKVTIYYDPGSDESFLDVDEACTTPTVGAVSGDVATEECEGTVELSVSPTGGTAPLSYQWFKNNTQTASGGTAVTGKTSSNTYTPLSGSFYYYCEVYSAGECEASYHASSNPTTNRVQIKDAPVVTASATAVTNYTPVVVSVTGPNVGWTKVVKSGTDDNSYLYKPTNSSVIFKGKGTSGTVVYTVTGTAENGCSSSVDISVSQDVDICQ